MHKGKLQELIKNPFMMFCYLGNKGALKILPDKLYISLYYMIKMGRRLNLENPRTFNEHIQRIKLYDRNPLYTILSDKYLVREYVEKKCGSDILIPLIGLWDSVDDIQVNNLPERFVLKCTHDSGSAVICRNKATFDFAKAKRTLRAALRHNFFWPGRSWAYKDIKPRIICEEFLGEIDKPSIADYKLFCFNGDPKFLFVATDRSIDTRFDFFDMQFNHIPVMQHYRNSNKTISQPGNFHEMVDIARILSSNLKHVRVDLYNVDGKIFFGEYTFTHFGGWEKFSPAHYDEDFGRFFEQV